MRKAYVEKLASSGNASKGEKKNISPKKGKRKTRSNGRETWISSKGEKRTCCLIAV